MSPQVESLSPILLTLIFLLRSREGLGTISFQFKLCGKNWNRTKAPQGPYCGDFARSGGRRIGLLLKDFDSMNRINVPYGR